MRTLIKLAAILVFTFIFAVVFLNGRQGLTAVSVVAQARPTPPANTATPVRPTPPANTAPANTTTSAGADKSIPKHFTLAKDSVSEYGEVSFDHDTHAFQNYSPDGRSKVSCVECHHTDQPKSALKPPLKTSERDVVLTMDVWKASAQKVKGCRECHFQDGSVPDDKTMPSATYTEGGKSVTKDLNNELAYHINCNSCHDAAAAARPELKKKAGFATTKDCTICHKKN